MILERSGGHCSTPCSQSKAPKPLRLTLEHRQLGDPITLGVYLPFHHPSLHQAINLLSITSMHPNDYHLPYILIIILALVCTSHKMENTQVTSHMVFLLGDSTSAQPFHLKLVITVYSLSLILVLFPCVIAHTSSQANHNFSPCPPTPFLGS